MADGHGADGHELDDVRLREARGGDDVPRDLRWVLWCFVEVVKCEFDTASGRADAEAKHKVMWPCKGQRGGKQGLIRRRAGFLQTDRFPFDGLRAIFTAC